MYQFNHEKDLLNIIISENSIKSWCNLVNFKNDTEINLDIKLF